MPRESGASTTLRLLDSIFIAGILDHPLSRMMTAVDCVTYLVIIPTPAKSIIATERNNA
jgi:hypothetical protein